MTMNVSRSADPLRFDVGIGHAGYADVISSPLAGDVQKSLLPGTTTVSQAIDEIFPAGKNVEGEVMAALVAGNTATLRAPGGFADAARKCVRLLKSQDGAHAGAAAREIENLLADTDLFEHYRLALLET